MTRHKHQHSWKPHSTVVVISLTPRQASILNRAVSAVAGTDRAPLVPPTSTTNRKQGTRRCCKLRVLYITVLHTRRCCLLTVQTSTLWRSKRSCRFSTTSLFLPAMRIDCCVRRLLFCQPLLRVPECDSESWRLEKQNGIGLNKTQDTAYHSRLLFELFPVPFGQLGGNTRVG